MALLPILHFPDERLHLKGALVRTFDDKLKQIVADMAETMYAENGIGLAAIQVNIQKRIIVIDISSNDEPKNLLIFINPNIVDKNGEVSSEEGCLSVPGIYETVKRAENIKLEYQDLDGKKHSLECNGLLAVCIQHEIDHLNGRVFIEYLSMLKQNFIKKKMKKIFKPA